MPEKIIEQKCTKAYIDDMAKYSIVSNWMRNVPDVKDGLKPVQRRIIFGMDNDEHAVSESTKTKCAAIVGTVMKKYHPHGDSSIYDTMKPLANWFECKVPLIRPGGSFGNIMGGRASAMRYTEASLTQFTLDCVIAGLHQSSALVNWRDNYTNTAKEPEYLPTTVPLLLINGTSGIGVGMKVDIPTHNLSEVVDATIRLIDNPNAEIVLIPDHCIACEIIDTDWKQICNTGNGGYRARGIIEIVESKHEKHKGNPELRVRSLPVYNTSRIASQVEELISKGKLPQVVDVLDASKIDIDIRITLKKGADANFVKEAIYKYTDVEKSFQVNFEIIDGIERMRMSYKSYLESFIQFAMTNKFRQFSSALRMANTRLHRLEAFVRVLESGYINDIIKMVQKRKDINDNEIVEFIIKKAGVTDVQAIYIINASIKQLSLGYLNKYKEEMNKLIGDTNQLESFIMNDDLIRDAVRQDLLDAKAKYGSPRLCKVVKISNYGNIPQGNFTLVVTENNYIRKLGMNDIVNTLKGDRPKFIMNVENTENVLLFDNKGRVFKLPIHKIPVIAKSDPGIDIRSVIKGLTADIISVMYEPVLKQYSKSKTKCYVAILTKGNTIKKLDIDNFLSVPPSGLIYSKLNQDDTVVSIEVIWDALDIVIYSGHKALRISAKEISCYKRNTLGVAAMDTTEPVEGMSIIYPEATDIVVVTSSGNVNRFMASGLNRSTRYKAGSSVVKLKNDYIQSIFGTTGNRTLNIMTTTETTSLPIENIKLGSSISAGIKAVSTKSDIIIKSEIV